MSVQHNQKAMEHSIGVLKRHYELQLAECRFQMMQQNDQLLRENIKLRRKIRQLMSTVAQDTVEKKQPFQPSLSPVVETERSPSNSPIHQSELDAQKSRAIEICSQPTSPCTERTEIMSDRAGSLEPGTDDCPCTPDTAIDDITVAEVHDDEDTGKAQSKRTLRPRKDMSYKPPSLKCKLRRSTKEKVFDPFSMFQY